MTEYRGFVNSGQELYERFAEEIAQEWVTMDDDPDPKYSWETVWRDLCVRFFEADKDKPIEAHKTSSDDILVLSRFDKAGDPAVRISMKDALEKEWDFDAHFQPIIAQEVTRQKKNWDFTFSFLVFDIDMPEHGSLSGDWMEEQVARIGRSPKLSNYYAFYTTKNGYRVVYKPIRLMLKSEMTDMRKIYAKEFTEFNVEVDPNTKDFSRIFRLPQVVRDGVPTESIMDIQTDRVVEVELISKEIYNYSMEEFEKPNGDVGYRKVAKQLPVVAKEILEITDGWPKTIQGTPFYLQSGKFRYLYDTSDFISWLSDAALLYLSSGADMPTKTELFRKVRDATQDFETIANYPYEPRPKDVYIINEIEAVSGTKRLDGLLKFFSPAGDIDSVLLRAAFVTPMLESLGGRPAFIIDSTAGRGAGKTSVVDAIGSLYGGTISVKSNYFRDKNASSEVDKSLMDELGKQKRVVLVDNVSGFFGSEAFAEALTRKTVQARLSYGKGTEFRRNDLTWFLTANDAEYDADAISRSVFLKVKRHTYDPDWQDKLDAYLESHREVILGEIINIIRVGKGIEGKSPTRYSFWCEKVLKNCCRDKDHYDNVYKGVIDNKQEYDADMNTVSGLIQEVEDRVLAGDSFFIKYNELHEVHRASGGQLSLRKLNSLLKDAIKTGVIQEGTFSIPSGSRGRLTRKVSGGYVWGKEEVVIRDTKEEHKKEVRYGMLINDKIEVRWK